MMSRRPVLFLLLVTIFAPIVLYTDRLARFTSVSSTNGFTEDVSTHAVGGEIRKLNLLPQESSINLKEPIGIVYSVNSSSSISNLAGSWGKPSDRTTESIRGCKWFVWGSIGLNLPETNKLRQTLKDVRTPIADQILSPAFSMTTTASTITSK